MKHTDLKQIERVLNGTIECQPGEGGTRLHDDHDGTFDGLLWVKVGPDGDTWISIRKTEPLGLRFRSWHGGGRSLRVHNALLILAHAVQMDNHDRPDPVKEE